MEDGSVLASARPGGHEEPAGDESLSGTPSARPLPSAHELAGTLHEVSNALTVIAGWLERARDDQSADLTRAIGVAASRARDARRLIRRAIGAETALIPAGDGDVAPMSLGEPVRALADVIDDAVTGLDPEARRSAIELRTAIDRSILPCTVSGGATIVQILTNLLLNAVALSPRGTAVEIDARLEGSVAVIGVADQGPGIPLERRATLLRAGVSTRAGGAGIGLRHSAALAEAAGGGLSLAPSARGARFELRWPARRGAGADSASRSVSASEPEPAAVSSTSSGAVLQGIRILVVEDDAAVVDLIDTALTARGASIVSVQAAVDLPGALASGPFHAALLDISPIEQDVPGTVSAVRSANPDARLVVMSGSAGGDHALPADASVSWVRKPFEIRELVEALIRA